MAFYSHQDQCNRDNIFTCKSNFTPYIPPAEKISLQDKIPDSVKEEKKKNKGVEYLPGERLLIQLHKQRKKENKREDKEREDRRENNMDVDRITSSLSRILKTSF